MNKTNFLMTAFAVLALATNSVSADGGFVERMRALGEKLKSDRKTQIIAGVVAAVTTFIVGDLVVAGLRTGPSESEIQPLTDAQTKLAAEEKEVVGAGNKFKTPADKDAAITAAKTAVTDAEAPLAKYSLFGTERWGKIFAKAVNQLPLIGTEESAPFLGFRSEKAAPAADPKAAAQAAIATNIAEIARLQAEHDALPAGDDKGDAAAKAAHAAKVTALAALTAEQGKTAGLKAALAALNAPAATV